MAEHEPIPPHLERAALAWDRYKRMMKWMVLAAVIAVLLALLYLKLSGETLPIHMVIATIAGVGLSVMLGTGLMGLVFLSNAGGHDDAATRQASSDE